MSEQDTVVEPEAGTPEYDQLMADKFDQSQIDSGQVKPEPTQEKTEVPPKPEGIPDKFYNKETGVVDVAAMAKSYTELEKGKGKAKAEPAPSTTAPKVADGVLGDKVIVAQVKYDSAKTKAEAEGATDQDKTDFVTAEQALTLAKAAEIQGKQAEVDSSTDAAKKLAESKGFDFEALSDEFMEHGDLTPETRAAMVKSGIPEATIDSHIAGQKALAAQWENEAFGVVGGAENYDAIIQWAVNSLSQEEIKAFDTAVGSTNIDEVKLAVTGLNAKYVAANGSAPKLLGGEPAGTGDGYLSQAQMMKDMGDPRYETDPAFRKQVESKLGRTTAF